MIWIRVKQDIKKSSPGLFIHTDAGSIRFQANQIVFIEGPVNYPGEPGLHSSRPHTEFSFWQDDDIDYAVIFKVEEICEVIINRDDPRVEHLEGIGVKVTLLEPGARP